MHPVSTLLSTEQMRYASLYYESLNVPPIRERLLNEVDGILLCTTMPEEPRRLRNQPQVAVQMNRSAAAVAGLLHRGLTSLQQFCRGIVMGKSRTSSILDCARVNSQASRYMLCRLVVSQTGCKSAERPEVFNLLAAATSKPPTVLIIRTLIAAPPSTSIAAVIVENAEQGLGEHPDRSTTASGWVAQH